MARCRQMGQWAITTSLGAHPLADPEGEYTCPQCGGRLRILRRQGPRELQSRLGLIPYNRPYGTCDRCRRSGVPVSGAPLDWAMALPDEDISIGMLERVCHASMVARSFADASRVTEVHDMVDISAKRIRELAEGEGSKLAEARNRDAHAYEQHRLEIQPEQAPSLLVICADGGRVQTRTEFAERGAKAKEGPAGAAAYGERDVDATARQQNEQSKERWKESKIGVVYDAVTKPQPVAAPGEYRGAEAKIKTYVATMQPWESFGWFLRVEAEKRGYAKAKTKLFLADGAPHIRELQRLHFPDATFILDWPHGAEHVSASARAAFGEGTREAQAWSAEYRQALWDGKVEALIRELEKLARRAGPVRDDDPDGSPRKILHRNAQSYFPNNREAVAYPSFRAKGWPIGSGVVEAAVKQFGIRMKSSEKFWNLGDIEADNDMAVDGSESEQPETGAEEMLALRSLYLSEDGRWERYWEERGRPKRWT